jgi:hypothetical protein
METICRDCAQYYECNVKQKEQLLNVQDFGNIFQLQSLLKI